MITLIVGLLFLGFGIWLRLDKSRSSQPLERLWEDLAGYIFGWGSIIVGVLCCLLGLYFVSTGNSSGSVLPQLYLGLVLIAIGAILLSLWRFLLSDSNDPTTNFTFVVLGIPIFVAAGASSIFIGAVLSIASLIGLLINYLFR